MSEIEKLKAENAFLRKQANSLFRKLATGNLAERMALMAKITEHFNLSPKDMK